MKHLVPLLLTVGLGCSSKGDTAQPADVVDSSTEPVVSPGPCEDVPTVTYSSFGEGFMTENCQGCHASTAADRYGAPEGVTFDTVKEVWLWQERILARSVGDNISMPPAGGVSKDDRTKLEWWLTCAEEGG
ncbi:MAG: hypothetical protein P8R54_23115 [Myxococcota bacterium]|nr:hypothetical protein [Myxococcota bacterium]